MDLRRKRSAFALCNQNGGKLPTVAEVGWDMIGFSPVSGTFHPLQGR